ncbi:MAG: Ferric uptake regulator family protein [Candidatus Tokpelaia hoelldobleri]|uniref:Ferric uptake regulation protein n=1 Tax=Candidatus Tokpelaia hoelldobleri TaxID=1902579 RepID=A0A1U9JWB5_9HYPH|nr:MAG: Ferric uptake regulator family protein [Candidatus Tokpelaia hoelldoblerii]
MQSPAEYRLREHGLRPTRQRLALAELIFAQGHRHIAAESLYEEALAARVPVSLATVYNTLHQFTQAGLLRIIAVEGSRTWFDTNIDDHHHFYLEHESRVMDIPENSENPPIISNLPTPPAGMEIANVDLIVRLRRQKPHAGTKTKPD